MIPAAPLVGAVTTRPPAAFSSLTASAHRVTHSMARSGSRGSPSRVSCWCNASCPAPYLSAPGSTPARPAAAGHAVLHHLPDPQQAVPGFLFRSPDRLVREHDFADRQPGRGDVGKKLRTGQERIGHRGGVDHDGGGRSRPRRGRSRLRQRSIPCGAAWVPSSSRARNRMPLVWNSSRSRRCRTMSSSTEKAIGRPPGRSSLPVSRTASISRCTAAGSTCSGCGRSSPRRPPTLP